MKYRAKITNCQHMIENIYDLKKHYVCHDAEDIYIEVDREEEAYFIEEVNFYMKFVTRNYSKLIELKGIRDNI